MNNRVRKHVLFWEIFKICSRNSGCGENVPLKCEACKYPSLMMLKYTTCQQEKVCLRYGIHFHFVLVITVLLEFYTRGIEDFVFGSVFYQMVLYGMDFLYSD